MQCRGKEAKGAFKGWSQAAWSKVKLGGLSMRWVQCQRFAGGGSVSGEQEGRQERQKAAGRVYSNPALADGQWRGSQQALAPIRSGVPACTAQVCRLRSGGWPRTRMAVRWQSRLSTSSRAICTRQVTAQPMRAQAPKERY